MVTKARVMKPSKVAEGKGEGEKSFLDILDIGFSLLEKEYEDTGEVKKNGQYSFYPADYKKKFGFSFDKESYKRLRSEVHDQMAHHSMLTIVGDDGQEIDFFPFQSIEWWPDGKIVLQFSSRFYSIIVPLLMNQGKKVYYSLSHTLSMQSKYSKRFYPYALEFNYGKKITFTGEGSLKGQSFNMILPIAEFRKRLCIPEKARTSRVRVICKTIEDDIKEHTDCEVRFYFNTFVSWRSSDTITHICFDIWKKGPDKVDKKTIRELAEWLQKITGLTYAACEEVSESAIKDGLDKKKILTAWTMVMDSENPEEDFVKMFS